MYRILIAPDSFKEALPANRVAQSLHAGLAAVLPDASFDLAPIADGGEGFLETMIEGTKGYRLKTVVCDALMHPIETEIGFTPDGQTAFIEMARFNGLEQIKPEERNPLITSTYGTGEAIRFAAKQGCSNVIVGLGGSATNDGGAGMAQALGYNLTDEHGKPISPGGGNLFALHQITLPAPAEPFPLIIAACDVDNPLTGPNGASAVYGPQKGASSQDIIQLDANLSHFAAIIRKDLNIDIEKLPRSGAAGGLAGGLIAFGRAQIKSGFEIVSQTLQLEERIKKADLVITGEGKLDRQTINGKGPYGVAQLASKHGKPVIAVAGILGQGHEILTENGFSLLLSIVNKPMALTEAINKTEQLLTETGKQIGRIITLTYCKSAQ